MKGNNELRWNEATMIEAVQEYLSARYMKPIKVTAVSEMSERSGYGSGRLFAIDVTEPPEGQKP